MNNTIYNILAVSLFLVLGKIILNLSRYLTSMMYFRKYQKYIRDPHWGITQVQHKIVKLFKDADIEDNVVTHIEPVGFGHIRTDPNVSVMRNIPNTRRDVVETVYAMFHKAIGVYRSRMLDALNPLYWIELIVFLPKTLFQYVGISPESTSVKVGNVIYWLFTVVLYGAYSTEINDFIKSLFQKP